jgi:hypothetical protein
MVRSAAPIRRLAALARAGAAHSSAARNASGDALSSERLSRERRPAAPLSRNPGTCFGLSFAFLVASALALAEQAGAKHASAPPRRGPVLWRADMEDRTLADWYFLKGGDGRNYGGGEYNSDGGDSAASSAAANRGGAWSARQTSAPSATRLSGTPLFCWYEPDRIGLHYSAWFYFPQRLSIGGWFLLWQWKSPDETRNDPLWGLLVESDDAR